MTDYITFNATVTIPLRVLVSINRSSCLRGSGLDPWDSADDIASSIYADVKALVSNATARIPSALEDGLRLVDNVESRDLSVIKIEGETKDVINDIAKELFDQQERELACVIDRY